MERAEDEPISSRLERTSLKIKALASMIDALHREPPREQEMREGLAMILFDLGDDLSDLADFLEKNGDVDLRTTGKAAILPKD